mgnify:CR=1 FL=1
MSNGNEDDKLFKDFGQNMLKGIIDNLVPIGQQVGGAAAVMNAYDRLGAIGEQGLRASGTIAQEALDNSQVKPFTVKVGSSYVDAPYSSSDVTVGSDADGGSDLAVNLSQQEGRIKAKLLEQARQGLLVDTHTATRRRASKTCIRRKVVWSRKTRCSDFYVWWYSRTVGFG